MLFKFKSQATADMIMLEPDARKVLQIIGKDASPRGIITTDQIPQAIAALQAAVAAEDERAQAAKTQDLDQDPEDADGQDVKASVGLKQLAVPFIEMLRRSAAEQADVVWGG